MAVVALGGCATAGVQPDVVAAIDPAPAGTADDIEEPAGVDAERAAAPVRVAVRTGAVWASDGEVFWGYGCLQSRPPQCGRELRIEGLAAGDLAAMPGAESQRVGDDGPMVTWLDEPVRLVADYDRMAGTLTVVAPPEPVTLEESSDSFARQQFLGAHRPDPPCEPTGTWGGPVPEDLDRADIQGWLEAVNRYTADADGFVHRWFADGWVLVVQFTDAAGHLDRLGELYPAPLCVQEVGYSADGLNAAGREIFDAREQLRDDGVVWMSQLTSHRGLDVLVFLADGHSQAAIEALVDPSIAEHVHVLGVSEPEPEG